jgi:hypothetical protein
MLSRDRSARAAECLRHLPQLNSGSSVLLQVVDMDILGMSDFCSSLTACNDALIVAELKPSPSLPLAARLKSCEQSMLALAAAMGGRAE